MSLLSVDITKVKRISLREVKLPTIDRSLEPIVTNVESQLIAELVEWIKPQETAKTKVIDLPQRIINVKGGKLLTSALTWLGDEPYSEMELINGLLYEKRKKLSSLIKRAKKYTEAEITEAIALIDRLTKKKILTLLPGGKYIISKNINEAEPK